VAAKRSKPAAWPQTFSDLVAVVRKEVRGVLRVRVGAAQRMAGRHGVEPTADAIDALMRRGGKRFRAALTVAGYACVKPRAAWGPAVQAGTAIELLHAYLLIQDDWMDGDVTRRGGPSAHVALTESYGDAHVGAASAVLASDLAWGLAVGLMTELDAPAPRRLQALSALMRCHQEVIVGQQLDMLLANPAADKGARWAQTDVETVHSLKTASYTVAAPLVVGASVAGASGPMVEALERFARPLGIAFQLRDDLLGVFGQPEDTGKPLAGDLRAAKRTAVTALADGMLDARGRRAYRQAHGQPNADGDTMREAVAALDRCGVRRAVETQLDKRCRLARRRLGRLAIAARPRRWLDGAVSLVERPT